MFQKRKVYTVDEAKRAIEKYCAYQERCHQEVALKLKSMGMIPLAIDAIIVHCIEANFLNEERFSTTYASGKFRIKKWGKIRIKRELKNRQISNYNINKPLLSINPIEYEETFNTLVKDKLDKLNNYSSFDKKRKLLQYLSYRGWENEMIYQKINTL